MVAGSRLGLRQAGTSSEGTEAEKVRGRNTGMKAQGLAVGSVRQCGPSLLSPGLNRFQMGCFSQVYRLGQGDMCLSAAVRAVRM